MNQIDMFKELGYPENVLFARGARDVANNADFVNLQPMQGNRVTVLAIQLLHAKAGTATVNIMVGAVVVAKIVLATGAKFDLVSLPEGLIMSGGGEPVTFRNLSGSAVRYVWVVAFLDGSKYLKVE